MRRESWVSPEIPRGYDWPRMAQIATQRGVKVNLKSLAPELIQQESPRVLERRGGIDIDSGRA